MQVFKSILKSIYYAIRGICGMVQTERNFRIHLTAILYVTVFAFFYGLEGTQWAILFLTFGFVTSLEIVNSSIENAVDIKTREQNPNARSSKDLAAAAVLVAAVSSVFVGVSLFSEKEKLVNALRITFSPPWLFILAASVFPIFIFIRGGKKDKKSNKRTK